MAGQTGHIPFLIYSALFVELETAFGAAHHDVSLSAGNADLLAALGTLINVIVLEPGKIALQVREVPRDLVLQVQEFLVFLIALGNIAREHPEVENHKKSKRDESGEGDPDKEPQDNDDHEHDREKAR